MDTTTMTDKPTNTLDLTGYIATHTLKPLRVENMAPITIRRVCYPNGREALQGAYSWQEGFECGVTWRDLPIIDVDEEGQKL